jgi:hypothetical protein
MGELQKKTKTAFDNPLQEGMVPCHRPDTPKEAKKGLKFESVNNTNEALKTALNTD